MLPNRNMSFDLNPEPAEKEKRKPKKKTPL
jgi:hypothetical protein